MVPRFCWNGKRCIHQRCKVVIEQMRKNKGKGKEVETPGVINEEKVEACVKARMIWTKEFNNFL